MCNDEYHILSSTPMSSVLYTSIRRHHIRFILFVIIDVSRSSTFVVNWWQQRLRYINRRDTGVWLYDIHMLAREIISYNNQPGGTYSYITICIILNKYTTINRVWSNNITIYITLERKWYDMGFRLDWVSRDGANNEGSILRPIGFDWTK
jgi:hypothetical protein